jgi:mannosyl-oligosaccharide alpha-1,2-mannosidase
MSSDLRIDCRADSLYPNFMEPASGRWLGKDLSMGSYGDSFYEYLLKEWIRTGKRDVLSKACHMLTVLL